MRRVDPMGKPHEVRLVPVSVLEDLDIIVLNGRRYVVREYRVEQQEGLGEVAAFDVTSAGQSYRGSTEGVPLDMQVLRVEKIPRRYRWRRLIPTTGVMLALAAGFLIGAVYGVLLVTI